MKKIIIVFVAALSILACNNEKENNKTPIPTAVEPTTDFRGLELMTAANCATCHKEKEQMVGPSYQDIANKYGGQATAVNYLSDKIIKGGTGVWGQAAMAAHTDISAADAQTMAEYILSLKK